MLERGTCILDWEGEREWEGGERDVSLPNIIQCQISHNKEVHNWQAREGLGTNHKIDVYKQYFPSKKNKF